jgi:hypothetical protein
MEDETMKTVRDVEAELVRMKQAMESAQRTLDSLRQEEEEAKKSHRLLVFENSSMESVKDVLRRAGVVHYTVVATTDPMTVDSRGTIVLDDVQDDAVKPKTRTPYRKWSARDFAFLREHYINMTAKELGARLGVSRISVRAQLTKLGLSKDARPWTADEQEFVRLHPDMALSALMQRLKRSMKSILAMRECYARDGGVI